MKKVKLFPVNLLQIFLVLVVGTFSACQEDFEDEMPTIANIAVSNANFSLLEAAAVRGGVAVTLSNKNPNDAQGNFTVFAPTNDAFAQLGFATAGDLAVLQKDFLTNTLLYHVSNGRTQGSELSEGFASPSLLAVNRKFIERDGDLYINGSKIIATDVQANNGIVHAIDKVMLATGVDIVQSAIALSNAQVFVVPELSFLVEAVLYADLAGALTQSPGSPSFTVFAPTDQAFMELGEALGVPLEVPADIRKLPKETVTAVLLNHVIPNNGRFTSELNAGSITPLGGTNLTLGAFTNGYLTVKGMSNMEAANMVIPDVQTTNGVVHVIDKVLLP